MSTRFEGAGARDTRVSIIKAGEQIGDDVVPEGQLALCFSYDEVFYIQGTLEDLFYIQERARWELNRVEREQNEQPEGMTTIFPVKLLDQRVHSAFVLDHRADKWLTQCGREVRDSSTVEHRVAQVTCQKCSDNLKRGRV